jgi:FO synthase
MQDAQTRLIARARAGERMTDEDALTLAACDDLPALVEAAGAIRDAAFGSVVTYSRKVFIPLTHLCRDVCHYCTFATTPRRIEHAYMPLERVLEIAREGAAAGCREALFTLGEKPELRYRAAREWLEAHGYDTTLDYLEAAARAVFEETGLIPHLNPGTMTPEELERLRSVSGSMGIMLESTSARLCDKGMPHYGSPDKEPAVRLRTLEDAGRARVPFTTGILIGIGETRRERIESLLEIRRIHATHGHVQEVIVQNFRAKPDTKMSRAPEPDLEEMLWTLAMARLIFGDSLSIQAPPNLSPGVLPKLVAAGIDDWGGVSPVTPDFVNPEAPWPHLEQLARETAQAGKTLTERLTIYPRYARDVERWLDEGLRTHVLDAIDGDGFPRVDDWTPGAEARPPATDLSLIGRPWDTARVGADLMAILERARGGAALSEAELVRLFRARGEEFTAVCATADALRARSAATSSATSSTATSTTPTSATSSASSAPSPRASCRRTCAAGPTTSRGRDRPPDARGLGSGRHRGLHAGRHPPRIHGSTPISTSSAHRPRRRPAMHVHAFSPLEVWQGAETLGRSLATTSASAEGVRDSARSPAPRPRSSTTRSGRSSAPTRSIRRSGSRSWRRRTSVGLRTTATIMYGHVDRYEHWARHLLRILEVQRRTGGFTEFVPLPFVHMEAPLYLKGRARRGPTFREAVLVHAVARLALHPHIPNIQASWVKMGHAGVRACLECGLQRPRRHAHERDDHAGRRREPRSGDRTRGDGSDDLGTRPRTAPAHHALRRGQHRTSRCRAGGAGADSGGEHACASLRARPAPDPAAAGPRRRTGAAAGRRARVRRLRPPLVSCAGRPGTATASAAVRDALVPLSQRPCTRPGRPAPARSPGGTERQARSGESQVHGSW